MIRFNEVTKTYRDSSHGEVRAVENVSLTIPNGETLCLIGTSGSGKTTLLRMVNRLVEPDSGNVFIDDRLVTDFEITALRRRIGYVIQSGGLFPHMTVAENVGLLCDLEDWDADRTSERVVGLLETVNLDPRQYMPRYPRELSGGQKQRVGLARALALDPEYILLDEPFGALDPITRRQVRNEFAGILGNIDKTVVLVTHDMDEAFLLADTIAIIDSGRIAQVGAPQELRHNPASQFVRDFIESQLADA